jgi:Family of unknown function (DUF6445)
MFNPNAQLHVAVFENRYICIVVDDALKDPDQLVRYAVAHHDAFRSGAANGYPGLCLSAPVDVVNDLAAYFALHVRRRFDARRIVKFSCRLSMITLPPEALRPSQWICHSDSVSLDPQQSIQASVLYLFKDDRLGGTSFYSSTRSPQETTRMFDDATRLSPAAFMQRYAITPGYMTGSNACFRHIGSIPARWNRLIFYDGRLLHSGDIAAPEKLTSDPLTGRLTLNGFFTCRKNVVPTSERATYGFGAAQ